MISFRETGLRLRQLRRQKGLAIDTAARSAGISRALLYRYEAGDIIKLDVLQRLARTYGTSVVALLGSAQEYITNAVQFFERLEKLEAEAVRITTVFGPLAYVLASDSYEEALFRALAGQTQLDNGLNTSELSKLRRVLRRRKVMLRERQTAFINIIPIDEISYFLEQATSAADMRPADRATQRALARQELDHLCHLLNNPPMGVQIGLTGKRLPTSGFQLLAMRDRTLLVTSPFRLAEPINLRYGVATISDDEQAIRSHTSLATRLWADVQTGQQAATRIMTLLRNRT